MAESDQGISSDPDETRPEEAVLTNSMALGELQLAFTDQYSRRWDDESTGGKHYGACRRPVASGGYVVTRRTTPPGWT